jgi:hypothetical protein
MEAVICINPRKTYFCGRIFSPGLLSGRLIPQKAKNQRININSHGELR